MHNKVDLAALAVWFVWSDEKMRMAQGFRWTWDVRIMLQMQQWSKNKRANERGQIMSQELHAVLPIITSEHIKPYLVF